MDPILTHRQGVFPRALPTPEGGRENRFVWVKVGMDWPFFALASECIVDVLPQSGSQCFPFFTYNEDGTNRRENITDWALAEFRKHYEDETITKWDIFYYVYGVLHHPVYREKFAENLKRELPRIPFIGGGNKGGVSTPPEVRPLTRPSDTLSPEHGGEGRGEGVGASRAAGLKPRPSLELSGASAPFWAVSRIGKELADLHINYEKLEQYPLEWLENRSVPLSYRVEDKMRLSKDKRSLKVNESLTLGGIPPGTFEYRLGNRSALEWVIDQYQVTEHNGIRSDPNREDDPEYIVRLVGQVVRVSLETVRLVASLPPLADA